MDIIAPVAMAAGMVWLAFKHPLALLAILILLAALMIWLLPRLWHGVRRVITAAISFASGK